MKKALWVIMCLVVMLTFCACSNGKTISGSYYVKADDMMNSPYIYFSDNSSFSMGSSVFASYAEFGDYEIKGGKLFATSQCADYVFEFVSSKQLRLIDCSESGLVCEGTVFTLIEYQ
ncbi:MAG: hypothetical protein IKK10_01310 [Clostridia bacterium]|nr:hypothetical protein [Clostridia bacterium]